MAVRLALGRVATAVRDVRRTVPRLPQSSSYLEQQFLAFQKTLEELSMASRDLILHGEKVVSMASGQQMGDISFDAVFALLESPLDYLSDTQAAMEELALGLRHSVDAISRLLQIERALEATVAPLQITQVMFRIQSAYLPSEHRQVFNSVTDEIVALQRQIQSAFSEHVRVLSGLHENLLAVVKRLEHEIETHGRKVKEKRIALGEYLVTLTNEIRNNAGRKVELTAASEELGEKVSSAVVTLQTQDIVAQKMEHARSGINDVIHALDDCEKKNNADCFERVNAMTRVEVAQLDSVIAELQNSDSALRAALNGITGLLEKLNGDTLMLKEFGEMTISASGSIQGLLDSLEEIREMVATTLATTKMAEDSVLPVRTATEGLTNTVQGVAHEMHLIALNAQIQAIQMGEGTGLDVLAAHSTEVSQSTTRISMEVASKVSEVAAAVAQHSDRLSALREAGQRQQAELDERGQAQEAALHRFRDETLDEFRATGAALDRARETGAAILTVLNLKPAVENVSAVRASLAALQQQTAALEKAFASSDLRQVHLTNIEKNYTMASERRIHSEILGRPIAAQPIQTVELWDEEDPPHKPITEVTQEKVASTDLVGASVGDFGEGAELF